MIVLRLPHLPTRFHAQHPLLIENLLEFAETGHQDAVNASIEMLSDFHQHDLNSRYLKKLIGLPFWELKTRSRGGIKGGIRIYVFIADDMAFCVNAEIKPANSPNPNKLEEVAMIFRAYKAGKQILKEEL
jgi:hypothetical protein